jgi:hypothetical protein
MAITISNSTVSDMHISITTMSSFGAWRSRLTTLCASLIFHATISSRAAIADSGSQESSGARISSARITSRAWITAEPAMLRRRGRSPPSGQSPRWR